MSVSDGTNIETATFSVPLTAQPDAPVVNTGITNQQATEEAAFSFTVPADAFADPDSGDTLTLTASLAGGAPLPAWLNFNGTTFSGTPDDPDTGTITVEVTASDTQAGTADVSTTFTLQVTPVNDAALISGDVSGSLNEDDAATTGNLNHTDADNPNDEWSTTVVSQGQFGALSIETDGAWEYSPTSPALDELAAGETLTDTITVATSDGTQQQISITINGSNDLPIVTGDGSGQVSEDSGVAATGDLDHTDVDGPDDLWDTNVVQQGTLGSLTIGTDGQWSYVVDDANPTVNALAFGDSENDTVIVQTADGRQQFISIMIDGANDAAVITGDVSGSIVADAVSPAQGDLDHTDVDGPGADDEWNTTVVSQGAHGTMTLGIDGQWSYSLTPGDPTVAALAAGDSLVDSVTVATQDGTQQVISIQVIGTSDPSVITGDTTGSADEDTAVNATGNLDSTDPDGPDDTWNTNIVSQGSFGTLSITAAGAWTYVVDNANPTVNALANDGSTGVDTLIDTVTVATADGTEQVIAITINGANDAALISGDVTGGLSEDVEGTSGDLNHTDVDNTDDVWDTNVVTQGTLGELGISSDGSWEYSPTSATLNALGAGETATDTITVATEDGTQQQISITINGDNDDAVITGDVSGVMGQDDEGTSGDLNHTDVDNNNPDDAWNTTVVSQGSFGTLTIQVNRRVGVFANHRLQLAWCG